MFKSILVAVDGSEPSTNAVRIAARMAAEQGAKLTLLHALHHSASPSHLREVAESLNFTDRIEDELEDVDVVTTAAMAPGVAVVTSLSAKALKKFGEQLVGALSERAKSEGVKTIVTHCTDEAPAKGILDYAENHGIDLIVLGSRGMGKITGLILGSVSQKVIEDSALPCLVVK
jgi:nucleotide-binding universal stress UspA family protein